MARDILSEYGPEAHKPQVPRARSGGVTMAKPTSYSPPQGPTNLHHERPGLGGDNHGHAFCPVAGRGEGGHAGIGGERHKGGSQRG